MNKFLLSASAIGILVLALASCGSSKQVAPYYYPQQQPRQQPQSTPQVENIATPAQPKMRKREVDECINLANEESERMRAYGTANSYIEEVALQNAEANAVTNMVRRMETMVEGGVDIYNKSANLNNAKKLARVEIGTTTKQYFANLCGSYRVLKTNLYDLSDNSITCYVCIELRAEKEKIVEDVLNTLSKDELLEMEYDKKLLEESMKEGIEKFKQSKGL